MVTIENLVPEKHFLRRLEQRVDFTFIYEETKNGYCPNNGRPSVDPVVLVKYLLIGFLYGIPSERRIEQEIQVNMAYRWFLGLDMDERVPDHSTISQNRRRRFRGEALFRRLFERILEQCIENGLVKHIEYMRNHLGLNIKKTGGDSAYGASLICQTLEDLGIELYTPKAFSNFLIPPFHP